MTSDELHDLFLEAARTERELPGERRRSFKVAWPDIPAGWSAYGYTPTESPRLGATAAQIDRYSLALDLTMRMDVEDRKLVWAVAHSAARRYAPAWSRLGRWMHVHPRTVKRRYFAALIDLSMRI